MREEAAVAVAAAAAVAAAVATVAVVVAIAMVRRKEKREGRERRESKHGGYATRGRSRDNPGCVYLYEPGERTRNLLAVCSGWCVQRDARHRSTPSSRYRARGCVRAGWLAGWSVGVVGVVE